MGARLGGVHEEAGGARRGGGVGNNVGGGGGNESVPIRAVRFMLRAHVGCHLYHTSRLVSGIFCFVFVNLF